MFKRSKSFTGESYEVFFQIEGQERLEQLVRLSVFSGQPYHSRLELVYRESRKLIECLAMREDKFDENLSADEFESRLLPDLTSWARHVMRLKGESITP